MSYQRRFDITFGLCDAAGIVFYPRYFEMTNLMVEQFFAEVLDYPYSRIHLEEGNAVPTVHIEADFRAPSRLGETVTWTLDLTRIGTSSADFALQLTKDGDTRLAVRLTLVWVGREGRPEAWPTRLRERMNAHCLKGQDQ